MGCKGSRVQISPLRPIFTADGRRTWPQDRFRTFPSRANGPRGIPTGGIGLKQRAEKDADGRVRQIELELTLPDDFPAAYRGAVLRAAKTCKVKRHLESRVPVHLQLLTTV